ncbi:MAG: hypothetical protein V3V35_10955 [Dehalococcoidia bacterium]
MRFSGRVGIVTGASRGIYLALQTASAYAREGALVAIAAVASIQLHDLWVGQVFQQLPLEAGRQGLVLEQHDIGQGQVLGQASEPVIDYLDLAVLA